MSDTATYRHTKGVDHWLSMQDVCEIMGHSSSRITEKYAKINPNMLTDKVLSAFEKERAKNADS